MKIRTKKTDWQSVEKFEVVAATLTGLGWRKAEDDFLVLDDRPRGFAQAVGYGPDQYIVEWEDRPVAPQPEGRLFRAQRQQDFGGVIHEGNAEKGRFPLYECDLLNLAHTVEVLRAFWRKRARPARLFWRDLSDWLGQVSDAMKKRQQADTAKTFSVLVMEMFNYMDKDEETLVGGFKTFEAAREYARRRTRDSVEEQRAASTSPKDLHDRWFMFGEDCVVIGGEDYSGGAELDFFIANPATPEERDWANRHPGPLHV